MSNCRLKLSAVANNQYIKFYIRVHPWFHRTEYFHLFGFFLVIYRHCNGFCLGLVLMVALNFKGIPSYWHVIKSYTTCSICSFTIGFDQKVSFSHLLFFQFLSLVIVISEKAVASTLKLVSAP